jgi:hypothetical protein
MTTRDTPEAICRAECTSGCHSDDCEHHGHLPIPPTRDTPEAELARVLETAKLEKFGYPFTPTELAAAILAALDGWTLVNEARLAIALHYAMCDVSHHDGGPMGHGCHSWPKYPAIARTVMRALAPAPSEPDADIVRGQPTFHDLMCRYGRHDRACPLAIVDPG